MVSRYQTVEDGGPRQPIEYIERTDATIRMAFSIRLPLSSKNFGRRLLITASMETEDVTMRFEGDDR